MKKKMSIKPLVENAGAFCGSCNGYLLSNVSMKYKQQRDTRVYCPYCGKKVDWSELEKQNENSTHEWAEKDGEQE